MIKEAPIATGTRPASALPSLRASARLVGDHLLHGKTLSSRGVDSAFPHYNIADIAARRGSLIV